MTEQPAVLASAARRTPLEKPPLADLVLGALALVMFSVAGLKTFDWSFRTALFPRIVTAAGVVLAVLFLLAWARARHRHRPLDPEQGEGLPVSELLDEDDLHDQDVEYVYATAGRAAWMQALAWVALFVVLLYVTGLFVTSAVFAFTYLRWGAGRSWLFSAVYAAVMSGVLYVALAVLLVVSVPEGLFS
ncbi:MAG: tripartite tricarboxylate transporter TctB family protein [Mycobacteriales bacterium]